MQDMFTSEFFIQNRKRLRKEFTQDISIAFTANGLLQRNGDNTFPFRQESSFWYFSGIDEPDVVLVMDPRGDYLIVPGRSSIRERFDGALDYEALQARSGVDEVLNERDGWRRLKESLHGNKKIATLLAAPPYIAGYGMYVNPARQRFIRRLKRTEPTLEITDIRTQVTEMRMVKQPQELKAIQRAIDITSQTLQTVLEPGKWSSYKHEYEVEADLIAGYRRSGAESISFSPIVAGGIRACTFHNVINQSELTAHELVVIDTGVEVSHYASDITRTVAYGEPTDRQRAVFDAVLDAQNYGIGLLKPGLTFREWDQQVRAYVGQKLIELKLIQTPDAASIARYYPHYSHFMGLDVHDVGNYAKPFEAGMVLTCEPGIYVVEEAIGVRIEDDILITENGHQVLSAELPRQL